MGQTARLHNALFPPWHDTILSMGQVPIENRLDDMAPESLATPASPSLKFFGKITALVTTPVELGTMSGGTKRIIPITGGTFQASNADGEAVSGTILPGGADFQTLRSATSTELLAKYAVRMSDGECVEIDNFGIRTASEEDIASLVAGEPVPSERVYFRCVPKLAGTGAWAWLSDRIFIGSGQRYPDRVEVDVFEVL